MFGRFVFSYKEAIFLLYKDIFLFCIVFIVSIVIHLQFISILHVTIILR
jgi:hypothetical protein